MTKMSGGEALAKSLVREGVEVVFGLPGIQMYGVVAALREEPGIRMVTTRHEQATTFMADGYARASGQPGVALVVPGCGLLNAASGLSTAYSRSSPLLLIAGQVPRGMIGRNLGAVHEVLDQQDAVRNLTKWGDAPSGPGKCLTTCPRPSGRCAAAGPVRFSSKYRRKPGLSKRMFQLRNPAPVSPIVPDPDHLKEAARVITRSRLPLIFAGGGVARSNGEEALARLAETTNIPVVTSSGGKGTIPDRHPLCYGSCFSARWSKIFSIRVPAGRQSRGRSHP